LVATPDASALQRSDLNDFLFADVGTEANGMILSVVSVLARQGSDPWREARRLADLPNAAATDRLAQAIADMPNSQWNLPDARTIAARLIGLLPARPAIGTARAATFAIGRSPSVRKAMAIVCIVLGIGYAISMLMHPKAVATFDGSDVASFTTSNPGQAGGSSVLTPR
jgi:hypothetical protein